MSEPTPTQSLVLWCLLGRCGRAAQGTLVPAVRKPDREALAAAGLIAVEKAGRSFVLSVTDRGWHWAGRNLQAPLPPNLRVLRDWLGRIDRHLAATGQTLADLVGSPPETAPEPAPETKAAPKRRAAAPRKAAPKAGRPLGPRQLRARIEAAYLDLTGGARAEAVRLSDLRAALADLDRATVDSGLAAILRKDATARLSQFSDPKALTPAEHAAAYSPAGEPFHILWIR
ncbi:hypothetical protein MKK70_06990 [Methylobacterium sp. E-041]|jgi:hypothetical protein|uniref:hypothetical protein n=1 Tax=unclassified Methylobacterium TaxID=2615210 RepID=UPI0011CAEF89|nr:MULTISPECIES: hypothetical protein [unclassified Methylobacterium]MCJ2038585.1 hypothetical protein [Methylobacterium sp. J-059]MCJ2105129.1 hypothetical protein [Methylobacterium sp. E-041]TXM88550.1 hypothetical protein FV223_24255 [Methylobacterium sp. WL116]TXN27733.1 hypothetical protein FV225_21620 [Methylobacterium sp. WL93]TXN50154.1 hypothetical protein FV227_13355 [Methylobacterium sp. WL119]